MATLEEMGELAQVLSKIYRRKNVEENMKAMVEEAADVINMVEQSMHANSSVEYLNLLHEPVYYNRPELAVAAYSKKAARFALLISTAMEMRMEDPSLREDVDGSDMMVLGADMLSSLRDMLNAFGFGDEEVQEAREFKLNRIVTRMNEDEQKAKNA